MRFLGWFVIGLAELLLAVLAGACLCLAWVLMRGAWLMEVVTAPVFLLGFWLVGMEGSRIYQGMRFASTAPVLCGFLERVGFGFLFR